MVAMQMTDEYMIDAMVAYIKPHQLHLGSLTTIDHKTVRWDAARKQA
jgi:hypothetical protein